MRLDCVLAIRNCWLLKCADCDFKDNAENPEDALASAAIHVQEDANAFHTVDVSMSTQVARHVRKDKF